MRCPSCNGIIRFANIPYCRCRFYNNCRRLNDGFAILTDYGFKLSIRQPLYVIATSSAVVLANSQHELQLISRGGLVLASYNGERLGRIVWMPKIPFIYQLLNRTDKPANTRKTITVITNNEDARNILSLCVGLSITVYPADNNRVKLTIPLTPLTSPPHQGAGAGEG